MVGLSRSLLGEHTPHLNKLVEEGGACSIQDAFPAVTCSMQTTYITGQNPGSHGIVGNGWYFQDTKEVRFWQQANSLVNGEKLWEKMKALDPEATCANLFWWYNMYSTVDYSITVRPMYPADGRKIPDIYTQPSEWREDLNQQLGQFPLFNFWGPMAGIQSSEWIKNAALLTLDEKNPTLTLVYLPHLDYCLQKYGPDAPEISQELKAIDDVCGELIRAAKKSQREVVVLSEYGIEKVNKSISLNRELRKAGLLTLRSELGRELLDAGTSKAFAVVDHQVAHVHVAQKEDHSTVKNLLENIDGVDEVWDIEKQKAEGVYSTERSGEFLVIAEQGSWFNYYFWEDDDKAPDYARTVDIHRKPGYDPVELFVDPNLKPIKLQLAWRLVKKKLGFRTLMDVIPLDASLVKGSHGRKVNDPQNSPILISGSKKLFLSQDFGDISQKDVSNAILDLLQSK